MHRPRGRPALNDLPQAWVPRVTNLACAALLLAFLVPVALHLDDVEPMARVLLVLVALPFVLITALCLMSGLRPGSVGRLARRLRGHRNG